MLLLRLGLLELEFDEELDDQFEEELELELDDEFELELELELDEELEFEFEDELELEFEELLPATWKAPSLWLILTSGGASRSRAVGREVLASAAPANAVSPTTAVVIFKRCFMDVTPFFRQGR